RPERQQGLDLRRPPPPAERRHRQVPTRALAGAEPLPRASRAARPARGPRARRRPGGAGGAGEDPPAEGPPLPPREGEDPRDEACGERQEGGAATAGSGGGLAG